MHENFLDLVLPSGIKCREFVEKLKNNPSSRDNMYRHTTIPKKKGGVRHLYEPNTDLKAIQRILASSLCVFDRSNNAIAYKKKNIWRQSYISVLKSMHERSTNMICLDIKNFFPSIKPWLVAKTIKEHSDLENYLIHKNIPIVLLTTMTHGLPQGAPTSPVISNIVLQKFDKKISSKYPSYTRYADDMQISSTESNNILYKYRVQNVIDNIKKELKPLGMSINYKKIKVMHRKKSKMEVLGISMGYSPQRGIHTTSIGNKKIKQLRGWIHKIVNYGVEEDEMKNFLGKISHYIKVDANRVKKLVSKNKEGIEKQLIELGMKERLPKVIQ